MKQKSFCRTLIVCLFHFFLLLLVNSYDSVAQRRDTIQKNTGNLYPHTHYYYGNSWSVYQGNHRSDTGYAARAYYLSQLRKLLNQNAIIPRVNSASPSLVPAGNLSITILPSGTTCGYSNGSFLVQASGGTPPYTYSENGYPYQTGALFMDMAPGTYNVSVKDASGQIATGSVTLPNTYPPPTLNLVTYMPATACNGLDGSITVGATGGTPPYQYSDDLINWQSSGTFNNLASNQFFLSFFVRDANGCTYPYAFNFFETFCPTITCQMNGFATGCGNTGVIELFNVSGGTAPYSYSIDGINYQAGGTFTGLAPGLYNAYIRDSKGQLFIHSIQIFESCVLGLNVQETDASCGASNGSILLIPINGTALYQYSLDGINFQASNQFTGLAPGNYSGYIKDATGTIAALYGIQVNNNCPPVILSETDATCGMADGSIQVSWSDGNPPFSYSIDGISFQSSNTFNGLLAGTYTVTAKDANGYIRSASITVNNSCLSLSVTVSDASCGKNNGSISVNAINGLAPFLYSIDGMNFQANGNFGLLPAGNYLVTAKDAAGATGSQQVTIVDKGNILIGLVTTPASCADTGGIITIQATGGVIPLQYSIDSGTHFGSVSLFNGLDSGFYHIAVKDQNGCTASDSIRVTALPTPFLSLGSDTTLCAGNSYLLTVTPSPGFLYKWQDNSTGSSYLVTGPGQYKVKVTNQYNCSAADSIVVRYQNLPSFTLGNDTSLCAGQTMQVGPAKAPTATYLWNTGSTSNSLRVDSAGLYWLNVTDSGCSKSDSFLVSYKPIPQINLGKDTTLCPGQTLVLDALNPGASYLWQDGSSGSTYLASAPGTYSVKVTQNGCVNSAEVIIGYSSKPELVFPKDTTLCVGQILTLDASTNQANYLWQDGSKGPAFTVTQPGMYKVQVSNLCGVLSDSVSVGYDDCACKFYVPNAFTPNQDGKNDVFRPRYQCNYSNYDLKVFNRWGQLVFESVTPSAGWDGNYNGIPQPVGAYVWVISYKDNLTGKKVIQKGTVILIL